jgi:hypothetical protein
VKTIFQILPLVQALLDAHFITLLLQRQSHSLLKSLSTHISTHLSRSTSLALLLGPLAIYAKAKAALVASTLSASSSATVSKTRNSKEKKLNSKKMNEVPDDRKFGEKMEKRVKAQEKHAAVGEYAIDKFWI